MTQQEAASQLRAEICSLENHGDLPSDAAEKLLELVAVLAPQPTFTGDKTQSIFKV